MMVLAGQFGTELIHDFHPGIPASGVFWTEAIPPETVVVDLESVAASMHLTDFPMPDFTGEAAGMRELSVPGRVSLAMVWRGIGTVLTIADPTNEFAGSYFECEATIDWSAANAEGFHFISDSAEDETLFAQIGRERTGVYAI
jgi:hypothetical protein